MSCFNLFQVGHTLHPQWTWLEGDSCSTFIVNFLVRKQSRPVAIHRTPRTHKLGGSSRGNLLSLRWIHDVQKLEKKGSVVHHGFVWRLGRATWKLLARLVWIGGCQACAGNRSSILCLIARKSAVRDWQQRTAATGAQRNEQ